MMLLAGDCSKNQIHFNKCTTQGLHLQLIPRKSKKLPIGANVAELRKVGMAKINAVNNALYLSNQGPARTTHHKRARSQYKHKDTDLD